MSENENTNYHSLDERWDYLIVSMILGDPFIHEFMLLLSKTIDESVKTMGVMVKGTVIHLHYSSEFLNKLTDSEARWVLCHEVLHIVFHHCTVRASTDPRLHDLHNIAADLAINQLIPNTGHVMRPRKEVINPYFPESLGFPEKLSMEQYFQLLIQKDEENKKNQQNQGGQQGQQDQQGSGQNGDQDQDGDQDQSGGSKDPIKDAGDLVDNHEGWSEDEIVQIQKQWISN